MLFSSLLNFEDERLSDKISRLDLTAALEGVAMGTPLRWGRQEQAALHSEGAKQQANELHEHIEMTEKATKLADKKLNPPLKIDEWNRMCSELIAYNANVRTFRVPAAFQERCLAKHIDEHNNKFDDTSVLGFMAAIIPFAETDKSFDILMPRLGECDLGSGEKRSQFSSRLSAWLISIVEQGEKPALSRARQTALQFLEDTGPEDDSDYDDIVESFATACRCLNQLEDMTHMKHANDLVEMFSPTLPAASTDPKGKKAAPTPGRMLLKAIASAIRKSTAYWMELKSKWIAIKPKLTEILPLLQETMGQAEAKLTCGVAGELITALEPLIACVQRTMTELPDVFAAEQGKIDKIVKGAAAGILASLQNSGRSERSKQSLCKFIELADSVSKCLPNTREYISVAKSEADQLLSSLTAGNVRSTLAESLKQFCPVGVQIGNGTHAEAMHESFAAILRHYAAGSAELKVYEPDMIAALPKVCAWLGSQRSTEDMEFGVTLLQHFVDFCGENDVGTEAKQGAAKLKHVMQALIDLRNEMDGMMSTGDDAAQWVEQDTDARKTKCALVKFAELKEAPLIGVQAWLTCNDYLDECKLRFNAIAKVHMDLHTAAVDKHFSALLELGMHNEKDKSWHAGADLILMTHTDMYQLATDNLFTGFEGKKISDAASGLADALAASKKASETFGFDLDKEKCLANTCLLKVALSTRVAALGLLLLREAWESGPQRLAQKRTLKKLAAEVLTHQLQEFLPKCFVDKLAQLCPKPA